MKLFKLKRKNIILVSLLAIAGFLGISSVAVNTAISKETPVAEKAEAAVTENIIRVYFDCGWDNMRTRWARASGTGDDDNWTQMSQSISAHDNYPAKTTTGNVYAADISLSSQQGYIHIKFYDQPTGWQSYRKMNPYLSGDYNPSDYGVRLGNNWSNQYVPGCTYLINNIGWASKESGGNAGFTYSCAQQGIFVHYDYNGGTKNAASGTNTHYEYAKSSSQTSEKAPTKDGYTFAGWKRSDTSATVLANSSFTTGTSPITMTAQWTANTYTITWKNYDGTILETDTSVTAGTTPSYDGSAPTKASTAQYSYTWAGWTSSGGTDYGKTGLPSVSGNETYTARYTSTAVPYNLTYKYYDVNGAVVSDATVTSTPYNTAKTLPDISISGYRLISWYESDGFSGTVRAAGYGFNMPASAKTFTAKCKAVGGYLIGLDDVWTPTFDEDEAMIAYGESNYVYKNLVLEEGDTFIVYQVPTYGDDTWHGHTSIDGGDAVDDFKLSSGGYDHIECKVDGTYDIILNTSTGKVYVYRKGSGSFAAGYYMVGTGSFAGGSTPEWAFATGLAMTTIGAGDNTAILESSSGTSITAGSVFKVAQHSSASSNTWYSLTLGGDYTGFATESNGEVTITKTSHYNFYFKQGTPNYIYIVDVDAIEGIGVFYYASNQAAGDIRFTSKTANDTVVVDNQPLSSITGITSLTNIGTFDGKTHLYRFAIYNLRGASGSSLVTKVVFNDGTESTVTGLPTSGTGTPSYYARSGVASTTKGDAAKAVYDVGTAIKNSKNKSVCDLAASAESLLGECTVTGIDTTLLYGATINTWNSTKPTYSGSKNWSMVDIIGQLERFESSSSSAIRNFSLFGNDENNFSTIIIIVASSVALLSVTALSILVIRKRKSKDD